ncbi:MAG: 3-oxoacyl-ACP reductase FabG [Pseudomonadota bacterium]
MKIDLSEKTALITGASGGIGATCARILSACGATVILSGTRESVLTNVAKTLDGPCNIIPANLQTLQGVEELLSNLDGHALNILVNNAGITRDRLAMRMKNEDWFDVIQVNLHACFLLSRGVVGGMIKQKWGRIINIGSIVGTTGNAGQINYAAAKAGLVGMTKSLASELAPRNVTVNCVAPGFIQTPMTDALTDKQKGAILSNIPAGRLGTPDDIGPIVAWLASDYASYITGQTLHINGGMAMV